MKHISDQIIHARCDYLKSHTRNPSKVFLDIRGMHDLYEFAESSGVLKAVMPKFKAGPIIYGMEVAYDPKATIPYAK